ncbi:hypothetical protein BDW59DRAFT_126510 [Aspergillus cavernicola]|uniref:F-box domain-containing protein n=1 Tax=Aspergillus cavernicola TaxID=176166 RepID=A0ABR4HTG2_9EURO
MTELYNNLYRRVSLSRLLEISNSPLAVHMNHMSIGFDHFGTHESHRMESSTSLYEKDLAGVLPLCLARLHNIKALNLRTPSPYIAGTTAEGVINTVARILCYVPLPNLSELEIEFPTTLGFDLLFPITTSALQIPIDQVMRRLRHINISIVPNWPESPSDHLAFPDKSHTKHMFKLIEYATSLRSLSISGSAPTPLPLDHIKFPQSLRLRYLNFNAVSISLSNLLSLVNQCADCIEYITCWSVTLNSGDWQHFLSRLCQLRPPDLLNVFVHSCGYSRTGESSHLAPTVTPPYGDELDTETQNDGDIRVLATLERQVRANRAAAGLN